MSNLTRSKKEAIVRIDKIIAEAKPIIGCITVINQENFDEAYNQYEQWHTSVIRILAQLFSDDTVSKNFSSGNLTFAFQKDLPLKENTRLFLQDINCEISTLHRIKTDIENDLYQWEDPKRQIRFDFWKTIIITVIGILGGIITGYLSKKDNAPGLTKLTIEGKWKYICTAFDGKYQHGGRFTIQKDKSGEYQLLGERMWRDDWDSLKNTWIKRSFAESDYLMWHSEWIYVKNNTDINFEYVIPMQSSTALGFCTGTVYAEKGIVQNVKGNFYVLTNNPVLTGTIHFKRVTDQEYNSTTTLPKNHN